MSNFCDLEATSIDPVKREIRSGSQTTIIAELKNNGPDILPAGEATAHVTVNGRFANKPNGFKSKGWKLDGIKTVEGNYQLYFTSIKDMGVNEKSPFQFAVKGKKAGKIDITLASTVMGQASDVNGTNQSVSTELIVK